MNNKGYMTLGIVSIVLVIASVILTVFYLPMLGISNSINESKSTIPEYINNYNGKERLYGILKENPSLTGNVKFDDLDVEYQLNTKNDSHEHITLSNIDNFEITNKTSIEMKLTGQAMNAGLPYSYGYNLTLDGRTIASGSGLVGGNTITINEDKIFNETTGETNYGKYKLNIINSNSTVFTSVKFDRLKSKRLEIVNGDVVEEVIIKVDNEDVYVYYDN